MVSLIADWLPVFIFIRLGGLLGRRGFSDSAAVLVLFVIPIFRSLAGDSDYIGTGFSLHAVAILFGPALT